MVRAARFRAMCLALADVEERPHFDRAAFRTPARIFATLGAKADVNLKLPLEVQQVLVDSAPEAFARLNGAWGAGGWTRMELANVDEATCREVLREAYLLAAPKTKPKVGGKAKAKAKAKSRRRA